MGRGRYVHPSKRRTLTPREAARIQGFPDSYSFRLQSGAVPSKKSLTKWIGDAVPPILAYAAGMAVMPAFVAMQSANHEVTKATRTRMKAVKRANTAPEALVRKMLREDGISFDTNKRGLPGTPDLVFRDEKVAVFVHGCYWHRHEDCELATMPKTNVDFWLRKFEQNKLRDKRAAGALRKLGWHPFVVWQCEIEKDAKAELALLKEVLAQRNVAAPAARSSTRGKTSRRAPTPTSTKAASKAKRR
jgi:DNA mismatch endonuclease (patch repair protein)